MTLGEQLALAVLKGDRLAAYALADLLQEERATSFEQTDREDKETRENYPLAHEGYDVYRWPEFQAFARRLGIRWNLLTVSLSIHLNEGEMVRIDHRYAGQDTAVPRPEPTSS